MSSFIDPDSRETWVFVFSWLPVVLPQYEEDTQLKK